MFCRDLIQAYFAENENLFDIDKEILIFVNDEIIKLEKAINYVIQPTRYYIDNGRNSRIKAILKSYNYINRLISKDMIIGDQFNPSMLCYSLLTTWFSELKYENNSKEFIYFTIYPYGDIYDKLLLNLNNDEYKFLNIAMLEKGESIMLKLDRYNINK